VPLNFLLRLDLTLLLWLPRTLPIPPELPQLQQTLNADLEHLTRREQEPDAQADAEQERHAGQGRDEEHGRHKETGREEEEEQAGGLEDALGREEESGVELRGGEEGPAGGRAPAGALEVRKQEEQEEEDEEVAVVEKEEEEQQAAALMPLEREEEDEDRDEGGQEEEDDDEKQGAAAGEPVSGRAEVEVWEGQGDDVDDAGSVGVSEGDVAVEELFRRDRLLPVRDELVQGWRGREEGVRGEGEAPGLGSVWHPGETIGKICRCVSSSSVARLASS